jgi:ABC-type polysaccharide/polyol phosphate export permease
MSSIRADIREIASYHELIVALAMREVRVRYKHTLLGVGWALALPLSLMLVFTFVFSRVATVDTGGVPYPIFAYLGLLPWQLHANLINQGARSLSDNRALVTKVYFAREVLPLSVALSALVDFAVALVVLAGLMWYYDVTPGLGLTLLPVVLLVQLVFGVGCALFLSAANLLYRDVQYVLQVGLLVWMFASSVVYPLPREGALAWLAFVNPMTPILDAYRSLILGGQSLQPEFAVAAATSLLVFFLGWRWFRRVERRFGELA